MLTASDARLVLRWTCQSCGYVNIFDHSASEKSLAEVAKVAEELGVDPDDLALVPDKLFCQKCETVHALPEGIGTSEI